MYFVSVIDIYLIHQLHPKWSSYYIIETTQKGKAAASLLLFFIVTLMEISNSQEKLLQTIDLSYAHR